MAASLETNLFSRVRQGETVEKRGRILKKGFGNKTWNRSSVKERILVLRISADFVFLAYYKNEEDVERQRPKGVIELSQAESLQESKDETAPPHSIDLYLSENDYCREHTFAFESQEETRDWLAHLDVAFQTACVIEQKCISFRVILIGDAGVGKSSILLRFLEDRFVEHYTSTIGIDFGKRTLKIDNDVVKLTVWDTVGQERFRSVIPMYFRKADGVICVFDLTSPRSMSEMHVWIQELEHFCPVMPCLLLVGNKTDLKSQEEAKIEINEHLKGRSETFIFTSAKTGEGVAEAFEQLTRLMIHKHGRKVQPPQSESEPQARGCC